MVVKILAQKPLKINHYVKGVSLSMSFSISWNIALYHWGTSFYLQVMVQSSWRIGRNVVASSREVLSLSRGFRTDWSKNIEVMQLVKKIGGSRRLIDPTKVCFALRKALIVSSGSRTRKGTRSLYRLTCPCMSPFLYATSAFVPFPVCWQSF